MLVNNIDISKISCVRKNSYGDGISEVFVLCTTDQRDNLHDIYEELNDIINSCLCNHYYFGIHCGPVKDLFYGCFFCLELAQPKHCD